MRSGTNPGVPLQEATSRIVFVFCFSSQGRTACLLPLAAASFAPGAAIARCTWSPSTPTAWGSSTPPAGPAGAKNRLVVPVSHFPRASGNNSTVAGVIHLMETTPRSPLVLNCFPPRSRELPGKAHKPLGPVERSSIFKPLGGAVRFISISSFEARGREAQELPHRKHPQLLGVQVLRGRGLAPDGPGMRRRCRGWLRNLFRTHCDTMGNHCLLVFIGTHHARAFFWCRISFMHRRMRVTPQLVVLPLDLARTHPCVNLWPV